VVQVVPGERGRAGAGEIPIGRAAMINAATLLAAFLGVLVGWFAAKTLSTSVELSSYVEGLVREEAHAPALAAADAARSSGAPTLQGTSAPLVALSDGELEFPYGRCWQGSNESCRRPFRWRELNPAELSAVFSEQEQLNVVEAECPHALRDQRSGMCCVGAISQGGGLEYGGDHCNSNKELKDRTSPYSAFGPASSSVLSSQARPGRLCLSSRMCSRCCPTVRASPSWAIA
jgi:hypothetical protein